MIHVNRADLSTDAYCELAGQAATRGERLYQRFMRIQERWTSFLRRPYALYNDVGALIGQYGHFDNGLKVRIPLANDGDVFAFLLTTGLDGFECNAPEYQQLVLELALILSDWHQWAELEAERRGEKLRLLRERGVTPDTLQLLQLCGLALEGAYRVFGVELASGPPFQYAMDHVRRFMITRLWNYRPSFPWIGFRANGLVVISDYKDDETLPATVIQVVNGWLKQHPQIPVRAYQSYAGSITELPQALEDSELMLEIGSRYGVQGFLNPVLEKRWIRILANFSESQLRRLIDETLAPLLDVPHAELLETLSHYLASNQSLQQTAQELFVHPNTVWYRVKRAEQLLEVNLKCTEDVTRVWVALQAYYVLLAR
jgi:sugar diacid utilization regulator